MKFISQAFKYTSVRYHITTTNKDVCFSESCGKACRRWLRDERRRLLFPEGDLTGTALGVTHWFYTALLWEALVLFDVTPLTALSSETLRRGTETVQKVCFLFPDLMSA